MVKHTDCNAAFVARLLRIRSQENFIRVLKKEVVQQVCRLDIQICSEERPTFYLSTSPRSKEEEKEEEGACRYREGHRNMV